MADHFEEVVNLRLQTLETRVDDEAAAVKEHFQELRRFITESLASQAAQLRAEMGTLRGEVGTLRGEINRLRADVNRLDQRLGAFQEATRLEFNRLEAKMDTHHHATHLVLHDILRRLPAAPA